MAALFLRQPNRHSPGFLYFFGYTFQQAVVFCYTKDIEHPILITPAHQVFTTEAPVPTKYNPNLKASMCGFALLPA